MAVQYQIAGKTAAEIVRSVEDGVRTGALRAGDLLPTVRALAAELSVATNTAAAAYQQLRQRGIVETQGRHGTRVRPEPPISADRSSRGPVVPDGVLDLAVGEPSLLPDLGPALAHVAAQGVTANYRDAGVLPELAERARERLPDLPPDAALTVVGGALDGLDLLFGTALRPGDQVGVEDPGWAASLDLAAAHGLSVVPIPVDDDGPTPQGMRDALHKGVKAVIVTTRAQNPTGAAVTTKRAKHLATELRDRDVLLIEDDHAGELAGVPLATLAGVTPRWAFLRSASKPYGPDLRIAVLAGDPATVARVEGRRRLGAGWVSTVLQRTLVRVWETVDTSAAAREYDARRDALVGALRARGFTAHGRTGINVWVPVDDETRVLTALRDSGYAVAPGSLHRVASPPGVRVTIANLTQADIEPFADAFAAAATGGRWTV
ncbi:MAG: aminotransferase class I/II-fold pyridoxal phosphate-dependent enzyme [Hamadaea sp.]|uniref:aminotransferase class I/II-fold pyridoxal phosphate-dependent enzyme n=1 Tax=Hamadaea sp. TaxID=2024425 RepID=UPI00181122B9|nr:aminotransferase class I/II-fold pyridoxal phosphate-dependent enzyme [Hamadaea sp.]NUR72645.1 aminotransferase class I/II-fold pyridoxal phosphate-dependent enzyme [Hamadaea sp.]NUT19740.1 aminotransferase class I/II-fold pyridoxal phosphate-dependent enzyme [Hamadaea sp.]